MKDNDIIHALIGQVRKAVPQGHSELRVRTLITRPMWRRFNSALGHDPDTGPTEWLGIKETHRVYGSETVVVESEEEWSMSYAPE